MSKKDLELVKAIKAAVTDKTDAEVRLDAHGNYRVYRVAKEKVKM